MANDQILLVDDDEDVRETVVDVLEAHGFVVIQARNGQEGLDALQGGLSPCLILLDMMMPVLDGWAFVEAISKQDDLCRLPICVFSASEVDARREVPGNVVAVLRKPVRLDRLIDVIRQNGCPPTPH